MKKTLILTTILLATHPVLAADTNAKDDALKAAKALGSKVSYSWRTTTDWGGNMSSTSEGKTEKSGLTLISMKRGERTTEAVLKGTKGAVKTDEGWQSLSEAAESGQGQGQGQGGGRMIARMLQTFKAPAAEAENLVQKSKDLKLSEGVISGALTEEGAKELMTFRRRAGSEAPEVKDPKGTVKLWVKDGVISKYEYNLQGSMSFNGNDRDINRTTTVEIKDIGSTKVAVPEDAASKLN